MYYLILGVITMNVIRSAVNPGKERHNGSRHCFDQIIAVNTQNIRMRRSLTGTYIDLMSVDATSAAGWRFSGRGSYLKAVSFADHAWSPCYEYN